MTLFIVGLFGLGAVFLISGIEDTSLMQTVQDVWNNNLAAQKSAGQTPATGKAVAGSGGSPLPAHPVDVHASYVQTWARSQRALY